MRQVLTTEAARVCKVSPQTIRTWHYSQRIKGYRLTTGRKALRIPADYLRRFMRDNGMPTEALDALVAEKDAAVEESQP